MADRPANGGDAARQAPPSIRARLLTALVVGCLTAVYAGVNLRFARPGLGGDYIFTWRAARFLVQGHDPYAAIVNLGWYPFNGPFFYPLPAAILGIPFSPLSPGVAAVAFGALSAAVLAYGLTENGYHRLPVFLSYPFQFACLGGQYSPLLTGAVLTPWLGWMLVAKPNIGLALLA